VRRRAIASALVALALAAAGVGAFAIVTAQQGGDAPPPPGLEDVPRRVSPVVVIPTDVPVYIGTPSTPSYETSPTSCGDDWGDPTVEGTAAFQIAHQYGEIRNCGLHRETWVITTLGWRDADGVRRGGIVALYPCASGDTACLDNETDHPFEGWGILTPPYSGAITLMRELDDHTLVLGVGSSRGGQTFTFDLLTREFTLVGTSSPRPLETPLER